VLDNATKLEEIAQPYALQLYRQTAMGREYNGNILDLPRGAGYIYLREAVTKVINLFKTLAPNFILIAHTKESMIDKDGKELNEMSIDLTGKLARIVAADADAVGYVYRTKENEVHINFMAGEDVIVGARARHLENKDIVIAKQDDKGKIISDWKQIYQNLK
jgi:hypothetical protein